MLKRTTPFISIFLILVALPLTAQLLPELPLDFNLSTSPLEDGTVTRASVRYSWGGGWSSAIRLVQENIRYDFSYEDVAASLAISNEENLSVDVLALEGRLAGFKFTLGTLFYNNYLLEEGFIQETTGDPIFGFEEILDYYLLAPRIGIGGDFDLDWAQIEIDAVISPVFFVLQDQLFNLNYEGQDYSEEQYADGGGVLGIDTNLEFVLLDTFSLAALVSYYSYNVEEAVYYTGTGFGGGDFLDVLEKTYSRLRFGGEASILIPTPLGQIRFGGSAQYRTLVDESGFVRLDDWSYGFLLGYRG